LARILIVDDDTDLIEGQKLFLEKNGYTIETALTIEEGLAKAKEAAPDMIIADLMMEHYDSGFLLGRRIRQEPTMSNVPIVMLSGVASATGHKFAGETAALKDWIKLDAFLDKPVTGRQLLAVVEEKLAAKAALAAAS